MKVFSLDPGSSETLAMRFVRVCWSCKGKPGTRCDEEYISSAPVDEVDDDECPDGADFAIDTENNEGLM